MRDHKSNRPPSLGSRVYTKKGDGGETSLVGGQRVPKDCLRLQTCGTVDELNAFVGAAIQTLREGEPAHLQLGLLIGALVRVQHELFNLGSILATEIKDLRPAGPRITGQEVLRLEAEIDSFDRVLPPLKTFVLPGGSRPNADLHICRTVCRRAERLCVRLAREQEIVPEVIPYLNRLSDAFFVWSRWASHVLQSREELWNPGIGSVP